MQQTPDLLFQIYEHEPIYCKISDQSKLNDIKRYMEAPSTKTWLPTCTKFVAWKLTEYERVIFMDSDMLVVQPIDHVVNKYSNASFLAAPEIFPPDTFNSGFMVFTPSLQTFEHLLYLNEHVGSNDGGDQGVLNRGLCPHWYTADSTDTQCGRLPWRYNVEYHLFTLHHIYTSTTAQPIPAVLHFIGLKPWQILAADYTGRIEPSLAARLEELADSHILWRDALIRASETVGDTVGYSDKSVLFGKTLSTRASLDYHVGGSKSESGMIFGSNEGHIYSDSHINTGVGQGGEAEEGESEGRSGTGGGSSKGVGQGRDSSMHGAERIARQKPSPAAGKGKQSKQSNKRGKKQKQHVSGGEGRAERNHVNEEGGGSNFGGKKNKMKRQPRKSSEL
jgi:hypothetical protein